ncbi:MAG: hypothetical protein EOP51_26610 [Sphingobacteriales bacterium]|nr:MAG: hypothetical protein EOP51_26610 [Sphingobacteriales bacterium]
MKTFKNIAAAFALVVILFAGCKNPAEDVQIIVNTDIFKSPTLVQFVNAKKGAAGPQDFNVTITGPNADLVRTSTGGKSFKATSGLLNLLLDRSANPTPASPVKFTVVANATGFAPIFQDVVITSATDPTLYQVAVAEYANPAVGTGAIVDTKPITNGTTSTDIIITTPTNAGVAQQTNITVPTGTGLLDAAGASVGGGQLESRIAFNSTATNGTTPTVPGGNAAKNVVGANGQPIAGGVTFIPAGSVSIDMYSGGKEVRSFTKPVIVDMELNAATINPTTNAVVKAGETIPMWSLNDETGQWKAEGNATVVTNGAGKLVARMPITHLTAWSAAWESQAAYVCPTTLVITKPASASTEKFIVDGAGDIATFAPGETSKTLTLVANKFGKGTITVRTYVTNGGTAPAYVSNAVTSAFISNACNASTTFAFVAPPAADVIDADVYVRVKCSGKELVTGINAIVTITPLNSTDEARVYNLNQGRGSGQIVNGTTYKIVASVDGKSYVSQFTASKTNFQLPDGFDLKGTAVFTNGRLSIDGLVTKTDCN